MGLSLSEKHKRSSRLDILEYVSGKNRHTIRTFFYRKGLDIMNVEHFLDYLDKIRLGKK